MTREDIESVVLDFMKDLASDANSKWLGGSGNELMMLIDPVIVRSSRREEAVDLLLDIANSVRFQMDAESGLHFRALQGLVMLRHRASADFWRRQYRIGGLRYAAVVLEGLALVDIGCPFYWLLEVEWNDGVEDAIVNILPSLLEEYGTAKVASIIERILPSLNNRGYQVLSEFCKEEGITLLQLAESSGVSLSPEAELRQDPSSSGDDLSRSASLYPRGALKLVGVNPDVRRDGSTPIPLSFSQQRLWFLDQLNPLSVEYNESEALSLTGNLNVAILEQSFNEIVRRHSVLRTNFISTGGEPSQIISASLIVNIVLFDMSDLLENEKQSQVDRIAGEDSHRPFDLQGEPLLRITLLRMADNRHVLILTAHHIICDGWSLGILLRELRTLYESFLAGQSSSLQELPLQYGDFACWQRLWLEGEVLETQR
ncbi:MAG: condensation domain-containing protein, partial [Blastocatellia bacterium]